MTTAFIPLDALCATSGPDGPAATGNAVPDLDPVPGPWMHLVPGGRPLVFVIDGSRLYEVSPELFAALSAGDETGVREFREAVGKFGAGSDRSSYADLADPVSLSLNVAQACNLSCSYCYADKGRFGGAARLMEPEVAIEAIDRLLVAHGAGSVTIGFIGGEPFLNRGLIFQCVAHARNRGRELGRRSGFR